MVIESCMGRLDGPPFQLHKWRCTRGETEAEYPVQPTIQFCAGLAGPAHVADQTLWQLEKHSVARAALRIILDRNRGALAVDAASRMLSYQRKYSTKVAGKRIKISAEIPPNVSWPTVIRG
jgi:hypothetical protein